MRQWERHPHFFKQLDGVPSLQLDVEKQQVGLVEEYAVQRTVVVVATVYDLHLLAEVLQFLKQREPWQPLVFHDNGFQCFHDFS